MSVFAHLSDGRLYAACAVVLLYLAGSAWFLWPRARKATASTSTVNGAATLVAFASQTGFAEELARRTAKSLAAAGMPVRLIPLGGLSEPMLRETQHALFVLSTTGEGDAPDPAVNFVRNVMDTSVPLRELRYAVLALGDREYDNFCGFGHRVDRWLRHQGATAMFDVVETDNGDEDALRQWQHQLAVLGNNPDQPDWEAPRYERWRLAERRLLNPGSAGDPCFHIALQPPPGATARWSAGDIAEIDPRNSTLVNWARIRITEAHSAGNDSNEGNAAPRGAAGPLPHREYSIASLPQDGAVHLLVRHKRRAQGNPGLGSSWLTQEVQPGQDVAVRIRRNPNFHVPGDGRPLIMIGNGTGIAALRALLKARIAAGQRRNWLIFGERNAECDAFYRADLDRWHAEGHIERLDLVFSRDQPQRRYVQHRLLESARDLRRWVTDGAAIYVCGGLQGMAPGVAAALTQILGPNALEDLTAAGRYRRDVY